ncbi:MAG: helix-turn-helix transcriptional regulator [Aquisalimonadaceae bacterium]
MYSLNPNHPESATAPVVGITQSFAPASHLPTHIHRKAQLVYTTQGVMHLSTGDGHWVLPSWRALWIPPGVEHSLKCHVPISVRALYFQPDVMQLATPGCLVLNITPLARELIVRATELPWDYTRDSRQWRLIRVLMDELQALNAAPLHLPMPRDSRARRLCEALRRHPGDPATLSTWSSRVGASERTLARVFRRETGMSFSTWRQQLRIQIGIERLALGMSVTTVAHELGYENPSSFIAVFRRIFGVTPKSYFREPDMTTGDTLV